jgi:hypothetical protein
MSGLHQQAKDRQAGIMAKGRQRAGMGIGINHAGNIPIKLVL